MAIIPKSFIESVVSIGNRNDNGTISWIGTGFFVIRKLKKDKTLVRPFLVTNRHIVNNLNKMEFSI